MNDSNPANPALDLSRRFALDTQGFDALRAQANASPQAGLKIAAQQFDAVFTEMMLKSMREATPQDSPLDSSDTEQFTSLLDQQLSQHMSSKGIGVAEMMLSQLTRNSGMPGAPAQAGNEGNAAALNALSKAFANAQANGSLSSRSSNSKAYSAASALVPPSPPSPSGDTSPKVDAFVNKLAASAQAASAATGIPARFIIGQAALESNWGNNEIKRADGTTSHNVFGIKATPDWTGKTVSTPTTEYVKGEPRRVTETFRAYDSYQDAMTDYANLLSRNPRYAAVIHGSHDAQGFANAMQRAGYATDPHYANKLISIMRQMT
jgi:flagellar protein FlgJ